VAEFQAAARQMYGTAADEFLKLYPVKTDADVRPIAHLAASENGMLRSSRSCGEIKAKYGTTATYIDLFVHKHPYAPGLTLADQDLATIGAYHTADVPYWFDTLDNYNMFRPTRAPAAWDRRLTDQMVGALIKFAETGSPSTKSMPWPAWTKAKPQYLMFGDTVSTQTMNTARMDWLAAHPPATRTPDRRAVRD
jgi:para-nitrobenzyl esterase